MMFKDKKKGALTSKKYLTIVAGRFREDETDRRVS